MERTSQGLADPELKLGDCPSFSSRLRISLTAEHTEGDLDQLVQALVAARDKK